RALEAKLHSEAIGERERVLLRVAFVERSRLLVALAFDDVALVARNRQADILGPRLDAAVEHRAHTPRFAARAVISDIVDIEADTLSACREFRPQRGQPL